MELSDKQLQVEFDDILEKLDEILNMQNSLCKKLKDQKKSLARTDYGYEELQKSVEVDFIESESEELETKSEDNFDLFGVEVLDSKMTEDEINNNSEANSVSKSVRDLALSSSFHRDSSNPAGDDNPKFESENEFSNMDEDSSVVEIQQKVNSTFLDYQEGKPFIPSFDYVGDFVEFLNTRVENFELDKFSFRKNFVNGFYQFGDLNFITDYKLNQIVSSIFKFGKEFSVTRISSVSVVSPSSDFGLMVFDRGKRLNAFRSGNCVYELIRELGYLLDSLFKYSNDLISARIGDCDDDNRLFDQRLQQGSILLSDLFTEVVGILYQIDDQGKMYELILGCGYFLKMIIAYLDNFVWVNNGDGGDGSIHFADISQLGSIQCFVIEKMLQLGIHFTSIGSVLLLQVMIQGVLERAQAMLHKVLGRNVCGFILIFIELAELLNFTAWSVSGLQATYDQQHPSVMLLPEYEMKMFSSAAWSVGRVKRSTATQEITVVLKILVMSLKVSSGILKCLNLFTYQMTRLIAIKKMQELLARMLARIISSAFLFLGWKVIILKELRLLVFLPECEFNSFSFDLRSPGNVCGLIHICKSSGECAYLSLDFAGRVIDRGRSFESSRRYPYSVSCSSNFHVGLLIFCVAVPNGIIGVVSKFEDAGLKYSFLIPKIYTPMNLKMCTPMKLEGELAKAGNEPYRWNSLYRTKKVHSSAKLFVRMMGIQFEPTVIPSPCMTRSGSRVDHLLLQLKDGLHKVREIKSEPCGCYYCDEELQPRCNGVQQHPIIWSFYMVNEMQMHDRVVWNFSGAAELWFLYITNGLLIGSKLSNASSERSSCDTRVKVNASHNFAESFTFDKLLFQKRQELLTSEDVSVGPHDYSLRVVFLVVESQLFDFSSFMDAWHSVLLKRGYRVVEFCRRRVRINIYAEVQLVYAIAGVSLVMGCVASVFFYTILLSGSESEGGSWSRKKECRFGLIIVNLDSCRVAYQSQITSDFETCKREIHSSSTASSVEFLRSQWWQVVHGVKLKKHDFKCRFFTVLSALPQLSSGPHSPIVGRREEMNLSTPYQSLAVYGITFECLVATTVKGEGYLMQPNLSSAEEIHCNRVLKVVCEYEFKNLRRELNQDCASFFVPFIIIRVGTSNWWQKLQQYKADNHLVRTAALRFLTQVILVSIIKSDILLKITRQEKLSVKVVGKCFGLQLYMPTDYRRGTMKIQVQGGVSLMLQGNYTLNWSAMIMCGGDRTVAKPEVVSVSRTRPCQTMIFKVKLRPGFGPIIQLKDFIFLWALMFLRLGSFHILEDKDNVKEWVFVMNLTHIVLGQPVLVGVSNALSADSVCSGIYSCEWPVLCTISLVFLYKDKSTVIQIIYQ